MNVSKNMEFNTKRTIISCGRPGVGKSSLGNSLLFGDHNYPYGFKSCSDPMQYGVTREIEKITRYVNYFNTTLQYVDIPGSGDHTIDMNKLVKSLQSQLQHETIHAVLFLVAVQDNRKSIPELSAISFIKNLFESSMKNSRDLLWLVITRSGEQKPSNDFIQAKLRLLENNGLPIQHSHVVEYDFNLAKLKPFIWEVTQLQLSQGFFIQQNHQQIVKSYYNDMQKVGGVGLAQTQQKEQDMFIEKTSWQLREMRRKQIQQQVSILDMDITILKNKKMTCLNGHQLTLRPYRSQQRNSMYITCDKCNHYITGNKEDSLECRRCDFDLCLRCAYSKFASKLLTGIFLKMFFELLLCLQE